MEEHMLYKKEVGGSTKSMKYLETEIYVCLG